MIVKTKYDPVRDVQETRPLLSTDLRKALETGVVADTGVSDPYNDIDNPASVLCRVQDAFDAIDIQKRIYKHNSERQKSQPNSGDSE